MEEKNIDKQKTIDIDNTELNELIEAYNANRSTDTLKPLINKLVNSRVLVPSKLQDLGNGKKSPVPLAFKNKNGELFQPVYTDKENFKTAPKAQGVTNVEFMNMAKVVVEQKKAKDEGKVDMPEMRGIVINPGTKNVVLLTELLDDILKNSKRTVKLTEEQYTLFERSRFEQLFLPGKLLEYGQSFIDNLLSRKENYLDELYEESYQNKRMYPYIPEDFSVLAMNIKEDLDIIRINMPERDIAAGMCETVFITWNKDKAAGRYFAIVKDPKNGGENGSVILEVVDGKKAVSYGMAPDEGTENNWIIEKVSE